MNTDRIVDEMVLALCSCHDLGNVDACVEVLLSARRSDGARFKGRDISDHLEEARMRARAALGVEGDIWNGTQYK
jgi:hypothetical protein